MHRGLCACALTALAPVWLGTAPVASVTVQEKPAQVAADTMAVDFYAVTADGQPVPDLKAEEVQFRIDGRVRPVKWLEWVPVANVPSAEGTATVETLVPPPYGSNVAIDAGRSFVIAIENDSFRPGRERPLRTAIDRFLDALSPRDRVALVTMPYGGFKVSLTNDRERVRTELAKIGGQGSVSETGSEMACRTRRTLESLVGLVSGFAALDGPTNVLVVTSGMAGPRRDAAVSLAPGMCELTVDMFTQVGAAAGAARATFYVLQPEDLLIRPAAQTENIAGTGFKGSDNPLEGIEHLAGVTGAERLHLSATGDATLVRVARQTAAYYVLGFDASSGERNGVSRQIDVRVVRPGITVTARPSLTIPKPTERPTAKAQSVTPRSMLREARTFRELPLRGIGYVSHNPEDGRLKVVCMMEPGDASVQLSAAAAGLFDESGRLIAQWTADAKNLAAPPIVGALIAPRPGTYRLRVAATDTMGRSGSADSEVRADLAVAGGLKISSLVLGLSRAGGFVPRMQFGVEPVALGYLDIYGSSEAGPITVSVEIARSLTGPALGPAIPGAVRAAGEGRSTATVAIPIGALPPGDYVIAATVSAAGQSSTRIIRTLRKVGR